MGAVVRVENLRKEYGVTVATGGVSFEVRRGEIFGIVGPDGAGKTTTVECLTRMRVQDGGTVEVLGLDPRRRGGGVASCRRRCPTTSRCGRRSTSTPRSTGRRPTGAS